MTTPSFIPPHIYAILFIIICIVASSTCRRTTAADSFGNRLRNDVDAITKSSVDYGNIFHTRSSFVLNPSSVEDIVNLIIKSSSSKTTIAARGRGHSVRGQAMTHGGVVVNMTTLNKTDGTRIQIGGDCSSGFYAVVGAEQLWVDVLRATLEHGLAPVSWTDYLYLSVGGTLSNAGISGQAFSHGPQISNVLELEVVTGKGANINCSPQRNSELFFGVLGGLGQFGIITRAKIVLSRAPTMVKLMRLVYSNFSTFSKDQEYLIASNVPSYVEGFLIVNESTTDLWASSSPPVDKSDIVALLRRHKILYAIEVANYYDNNYDNQEFNRLLDNLNYIPGLRFNRDVDFFDFLHRVGNLDTPDMGSLLSHPWLNLFVPKSSIADFNAKVLVTMLPTLKRTNGLFIFYPLNKTKWDNRMSAVIPEDGDDDVFYTLGLLHLSPPGEYQNLNDFNDQILRVCMKNGINVKHYLPHFTNKNDWKNHFGSKWNKFNQRKKLFDPKMLFSPGQGVFNTV